MKNIRIDGTIVLLLGLSFFFFILYSWFSTAVLWPQAKEYDNHLIFSWPDAMANYFFIHKFQETGRFVQEEPLNNACEGIIHPRSTNIVNANIVPVGFLGMLIIYGWLSKILPNFLIIFLTPLLAVAAVFVFYGVVKRIFNRPTAFYSALLLFFFPAYWYYANQAMLSVIPFLFLLLLGFYFLIIQEESLRAGLKIFFSSLAGLFFGCALIIRPIEFIWMGILLFALLIHSRHQIKWRQVFSFIIAAFIPMVILLYYNQQIYGEFLTVGYLKMNASENIANRLPAEFQMTGDSTIITFLKLLFIPFGFHFKILKYTFWNYFVKLFWPFLLLFVLGLVMWLRDKRQNQQRGKQRFFLWSEILAGLWLIFYYGNWLFIDKLVLKNNTIGSSYTRYWVILNILIIPFAAHLFCKLQNQLWPKILRYGLIGLISACLFIFSWRIVFYKPGDGLLDQRKATEIYYIQAKKVEALVENNAIIISDRADKLFFPKKQTVVFNLNYDIFPVLKKCGNDIPLYYFTSLLDKDIAYINERKIKSFGLSFMEPKMIDEQFRLFKLVKIQ